MKNPRTVKASEVIIVDFPGVMGTKRRPAVILSSDTYHATRPDVIIGLITSQATAATAPTDYLLQDYAAAGLRLPSAFRAFFVTLPRIAIVAHIGQLSDADWQAVKLRVDRALA
jgi:mRNA interferase MazF